jgi:hypothetical protein
MKRKDVKSEPVQKADVVPAPDLIDFDTWHAIRQAAIPQQHKKEILKADFKARGLGQIETMQKFDEALRLYGVMI